jgi:hypothetical protein
MKNSKVKGCRLRNEGNVVKVYLTGVEIGWFHVKGEMTLEEIKKEVGRIKKEWSATA